MHDRGRVESCIEFASGHSLVYSVESSPRAASATASFDGHAIRVAVPALVMMEWAEGDRGSIDGGSQANLQLLIEKDFQCLHKPDQKDPDAYPNPLAS